jgi:hypothetical protein
MDRAEARRLIWERYDAGAAGADEVEARLRLVDRADEGDEEALRAAVEGAVPLLRRAAGHRKGLVGAAVVVALLGSGLVAWARDGDTGSPTATSQPPNAGTFVAGPAAVTVVAEAVPQDCGIDELGVDSDEPPPNPALLSEPAFVPEGYELDDDDDVTPGQDGDSTMSIAAGNPLPDEIRARVLDGDLAVRMRVFRYADVEAAADAGAVASSGACQYGPEPFEVPERPEIAGSVISGIIPTTAFASWRLGDRRFIVAVESDGDDADDVEEARLLAGQIAAAELDAARAGT